MGRALAVKIIDAMVCGSSCIDVPFEAYSGSFKIFRHSKSGELSSSLGAGSYTMYTVSKNKAHKSESHTAYNRKDKVNKVIGHCWHEVLQKYAK